MIRLDHYQKTQEHRNREIDRIIRWRENPLQMALEEFRFDPDPWQAAVLERLIPGHSGLDMLALIACMGPGKSAVLAVACLIFINTRPRPNVILTSITANNLRDGLWKEIGKWGNRSEYYRKRWTTTTDRIYLRGGDPTEAFISARQWTRGASAEQQEETLRGFHSDHCLVVVDEAGCVPQTVVDGVQGVRTSAVEAKIWIAGNPIQARGPLYKAHKTDRVFWDRVYVTGDPDDPNRAPRVSLAWAKEQVRRLGRGNPWVQANVLGIFPENISEGLIPIEQIEASYERTADIGGEALARDKKTIGVDVARRGKNRTVFVFREGDYVVEIQEHQGTGSTEVAGLIREADRDFRPETVYIDDNGIGGTVGDILDDSTVPFERVNACERSSSEYHANRRSELAGHLQERFRHGRISLPGSMEDSSFSREASELLFGFSRDGKRLLEDKDRFISRVGMSPDLYDGTALAFADGVIVAGAGSSGEERPNPRREKSSAPLTTKRVADADSHEVRRNRPRLRVSA